MFSDGPGEKEGGRKLTFPEEKERTLGILCVIKKRDQDGVHTVGGKKRPVSQRIQRKGKGQGGGLHLRRGKKSPLDLGKRESPSGLLG